MYTGGACDAVKTRSPGRGAFDTTNRLQLLLSAAISRHSFFEGLFFEKKTMRPSRQRRSRATELLAAEAICLQVG